MLLDFGPQVTAITAQPFWLRWHDGAGRARRHAPDLFARMADGSAVVIAITTSANRRSGARQDMREGRRTGASELVVLRCGAVCGLRSIAVSERLSGP
jgi:hypothetical protein